jgi:hypothetical protein
MGRQKPHKRESQLYSSHKSELTIFQIKRQFKFVKAKINKKAG